MMNSLANLNGKTVVVTGASGYIGSELVNALVKHQCNVVRVGRNKLMPLPNTKSITADIRIAETWTEIVTQADIIYHLAGNTSVYEAAKNPAESLISTLLPLNHLIKAAQTQQRKPRVVFASTATVYGLTPKCPVAETVEPKPITVYDLHKLFAERQLNLATQQGILESVSLRLANVYGPSGSSSSADDRGILNKVTSMALQGKDLTVYGDGNYLRDYVYIDDVVWAFILAGARKDVGFGIFNVSTGKSVSVGDAFKLIVKRVAVVTGNTVDIKYSPWPDGASEVEFRNYISDVSSTFLELGWQHTINLESGIKYMVDRANK
ncbi:WcaG Nucleoside-diphosphate-sugar epimerases [Methylophilaceae bacterium]